MEFCGILSATSSIWSGIGHILGVDILFAVENQSINNHPDQLERGMSFMDSLNQRSRRLGIVDWKMAQGAAMCLAIIGVKLFPGILKVNWWILIAVTVLLYIRPLYLFYVDSSR